MNRRLTLLLGVLVLAFAYACNEATTASTPSMPGPSFQWQNNLSAPPTVTVSIQPDANNPPQEEGGDRTFHANVSGGSGSYAYYWYWAGCNVNMDEEWCPPNGFFSSSETSSSFTTYIGIYDTRLEVVVEVQDLAGPNPPTTPHRPPTGKAWILVEGPMWGWVPPGSFNCGLGGFPLRRWEYDPSTGQLTSVWYRRHPCTGEIQYLY